MIGGNEISMDGLRHVQRLRFTGLDPCGTEICDNLVDARPSYQLGSVRIWNLQWGGGSRLRWGKVAPDVMVSPWCHGVGGVSGRHGEVAVVFLLQIAVGATWGGSGAQGKQVFHGSGLIVRGWFGSAGVAVGGVERHTVRGRFGSCRGGCGVGERSHRTRSARNLPRRPRRRSREAAYRSRLALPVLLQDLTLVGPEVSSPRLVCCSRANLLPADPEVVETIGPGQA